MAQLTTTASGIEVSGETVLAMTKGMRGFRKRLRHLLAQRGLDDPKPTRWYSQNDLVDVFEALAASVGPFTIYDMGVQVAHDAEFPPEVDSVERALTHVDAFHRTGHRGATAGSYIFEKTGEGSGSMVCKTPYPCDFDRGLIEAVAERFRPEGAWNVTVKHDESAECRRRGADSCTYAVQW